MTDQSLRPKFAVCVANDGCDDLSAGMLYRVLPDDAGAGEGLLTRHRATQVRGLPLSVPTLFVIVEAYQQAEEQKLLAVASANVA